MSTDRQKSFIGTLSCEGRPVSIDRLYRKGRKTSNLLVATYDREPARFYFRWEHNAYVMYVRDQAFIGQLVNLNDEGELTASPAAEAGNIAFDLDGMTLDDIPQDSINFHLFAKPRHLITMDGTSNSPLNSLRRPISERIYFQSESDQAFAYFTLNILERNAPYLSQPNEV